MTSNAAKGLGYSVLDDELRFQNRAIDQPKTIVCEHCQRDEPLPTTEPWLILDGVAIEPEIYSTRCPHCKKTIYLVPVSDEDRRHDEERDAIREEDDE